MSKGCAVARQTQNTTWVILKICLKGTTKYGRGTDIPCYGQVREIHRVILFEENFKIAQKNCWNQNNLNSIQPTGIYDPIVESRTKSRPHFVEEQTRSRPGNI